MTRHQSARTLPTTRTGATVRTGLAALAALAGLVACAETAPVDGQPVSVHEAADDDGVITRADGYLAEPVSPYSDAPAVTGLDPALRQALRDAARDAADDDVEILVTSGWRSAEYQESLLDDAVEKYGSLDEAREWVETPEGSAHVSGHAVDVGPTDAAYWMSRHGSRYGLCQTYSNEVWHYELATEPGGECPPRHSDASV